MDIHRCSAKSEKVDIGGWKCEIEMEIKSFDTYAEFETDLPSVLCPLSSGEVAIY